jgi:hypothetical protein
VYSECRLYIDVMRLVFLDLPPSLPPVGCKRSASAVDLRFKAEEVVEDGPIQVFVPVKTKRMSTGYGCQY